MTITLNAGQQAASKGLFDFLLGEEKELIISGGGGVGKTTLMGHMENTLMPEYENLVSLMGLEQKYFSVSMVATTNKAAQALGLATNRPPRTVYSLLGLRVFNNSENGSTSVKRIPNAETPVNQIIVVDESSFVDKELHNYIQTIPYKCKVIYLMDHCQLPPVKGDMAVYPGDGNLHYELTEPMRNKGQPALVDLCYKTREAIRLDTDLPKIPVVKGVIDHFSGQELKHLIDSNFDNFGSTKDFRILGYTNDRVVAYNKYIRHLRNLPAHFTAGETVTSNTALHVGGMIMAQTEEEITLVQVDDHTTSLLIDSVTNGRLEVRYAYFSRMEGGSPIGPVPIPEDIGHYREMVKYYAKLGRTKGNWSPYFRLKDQIADFRDNSANTVHKSQGSTYHTTIIDLKDLGMCRNPALARRLFYVGVSRSQERVIFVGDIPKNLKTEFL